MAQHALGVYWGRWVCVCVCAHVSFVVFDVGKVMALLPW